MRAKTAPMTCLEVHRPVFCALVFATPGGWVMDVGLRIPVVPWPVQRATIAQSDARSRCRVAQDAKAASQGRSIPIARAHVHLDFIASMAPCKLVRLVDLVPSTACSIPPVRAHVRLVSGVRLRQPWPKPLPVTRPVCIAPPARPFHFMFRLAAIPHSKTAPLPIAQWALNAHWASPIHAPSDSSATRPRPSFAARVMQAACGKVPLPASCAPPVDSDHRWPPLNAATAWLARFSHWMALQHAVIAPQDNTSTAVARPHACHASMAPLPTELGSANVWPARAAGIKINRGAPHVWPVHLGPERRRNHPRHANHVKLASLRPRRHSKTALRVISAAISHQS